MGLSGGKLGSQPCWGTPRPSVTPSSSLRPMEDRHVNGRAPCGLFLCPGEASPLAQYNQLCRMPLVAAAFTGGTEFKGVHGTGHHTVPTCTEMTRVGAVCVCVLSHWPQGSCGGVRVRPP